MYIINYKSILFLKRIPDSCVNKSAIIVQMVSNSCVNCQIIYNKLILTKFKILLTK